MRGFLSKILRSGLGAGLFLIAWTLPAPSAFAFDIPELSRPVVDSANALDDAARSRLDARLSELHRRGVFQMAIYLPRSLEGADIETYSMEVAEKWKLGKEGEDRGLLLVLAMAERRMRLEVGYGLEGEIPDAIARRILDETLRPRLREGDPALGLEETVTRIERILQGDRTALPSPRQRGVLRWGGRPLSNTFGLLIQLTFYILAFTALLIGGANSRRMRRSGWTRGGWPTGGYGTGGGGVFRSGGFGGGGGGFGGGGASSNW